MHLLGQRADRERRKHQSRRIDQCTKDNGTRVAHSFRDRAERRLAYTSGLVLDRNGHAELRSPPPEFPGNGNLEHAEAGLDGKADKHDDASHDQDEVNNGIADLPVSAFPVVRSARLAAFAVLSILAAHHAHLSGRLDSYGATAFQQAVGALCGFG